jgi:hypothetical protein
MASRKLISVQEYLGTRYRPDRDYVDGEVEERNLGEWDHSDLQLAIGSYLRQRQKKWGIRVVVEQREHLRMHDAAPRGEPLHVAMSVARGRAE